MSCITQDHTVATFLPPLDPSEMFDWWLERFQLAEKNKIYIVASLIPKPGVQPPTQGAANIRENTLNVEQYDLAGFAYLADTSSATGPFRGEVLKLLVSPSHRRKGIARAVLSKIEEVASNVGLTRLVQHSPFPPQISLTLCSTFPFPSLILRSLQVLDTVEDSPAEQVYPRLGWIRVGVVPCDGISPEDGRLVNEVLFYKLLQGHGETGSVWKKPESLAIR